MWFSFAFSTSLNLALIYAGLTRWMGLGDELTGLNLRISSDGLSGGEF